MLAPLLAAALLLLPLLYVGSYLALVTPNRWAPAAPGDTYALTNYRCGNEWPSRIYWPLEQIDRRLFPQRWIDRAIWH